MWWESTLWFVERRLVVDRVTTPARADRQAAGGAGYLGTLNFPMAHGPLKVRMCPGVRGVLDVGG